MITAEEAKMLTPDIKNNRKAQKLIKYVDKQIRKACREFKNEVQVGYHIYGYEQSIIDAVISLYVSNGFTDLNPYIGDVRVGHFIHLSW